MKQLKQLLLLVMAIALICNNYAQAQTTPFNHYSEWMAKSRENYVYINNGKNDFWRYDDGLMYESILDTYEHYKNNGADLSGTTLLDEVKWYLGNSLTKGTKKPNNYKSSELDDVRPAKLVWKYYNTYPTDTDRDYLDNCEYVMDDIENMRRAIPNDNTSPWEHKESYGNQVWLDGIFMCIPYYTLAGPTIGLKTNSSWTTDYIFQDAYTQIMVTDEKTYDRKTNLWKHAWDALGTRTWADCQNKKLYKNFKHTAEELAKPVGTGTWQSLHTWGRALGWYVMAIMETIDNMIAYDTAHSTDHSTQINNLKILFKRVVDSYIQYRDESKGCWYCVLDVDDTKEPYSSLSLEKANYLEGTCSSMFTYALLHGVNKGYLPLSYTSLAKKAYKDLVEYFIKADGEKIKLDDCISVAGLDDGAVRRDGSFAYYMDESVIASDSKGVGPFIWASLEAEKMGYTLVKNSSNFSVNFNSLDQTGINVYKWSKVYDEIDNLSAEYTSPTFTAKTVAGTTIANSGITFNSNNPSVATVSPNGTVTLVGTGLATITATKDEMVSYYSVKVNSIQPQVETPAISITEGTNTFIGENTTVTIACDTENADIYYTTDGSEPDNTATHYTGTFTISATTTVKAIAIKTGYDDSEIASETFTQEIPKFTTPTISGTTPFTGSTTVTITCSGADNIYYTTDGSTPTTSSTNYTEPFTVSTTSTVKAIAVKDGYSNSDIASMLFTNSADIVEQDYILQKSTLQSNSSSAFTSNGKDFTLSENTSGTASDEVALKYNQGRTWTITLPEGFTATKLTFKGYTNSTSSASNYISKIGDTNQDNTKIFPVKNTSSQTYGIYSYDLDNVTSNIKFTLAGSAQACLIITITGSTSSTPTPSKVANPVITGTTPFSSSTSVTMSCETTGATIHYTTDGSAPTSSSATYSEPINISATTTVRAIAVKEGMTNSEIASKTFTQDNTPTTFTLTNTVNTEGYGTVSPESVANIPSGTATSSSTNTYTVNGTTVTATPTDATAEYTYAFSSWSGLPETVTANATVTAYFTRTANNYTLAWNSNGGSELTGTYTNGSIAFGTTLTPPSTPTRSGYTFLKWNTAANGSGTDYTGTMPAANTTYYAQWVLEGEETSETVTPTGIDSSKNLTFSSETNLVVYLPNGSMEYDEAKFKGDAAIDISSVGSKYIKEIVITYDATSSPNIRHPENANDLTIINVTSNGSVVTSGSVLGSVTSTTSEPFTTTWSDNSGAKNINKVTLNYANNSHSLYISNIKVTYWGASETPTVEAPTFTAHPANATYTQGDTPTALSVTATGNPAPTYQWYKNTDNDKTAKVADQIEGATAATLPVANISTATAGTFYYYCVATNSEGTATSNSATITVNAPALAISTQPIGASYTQDDTATALSVTATGGSTPYSYQWYSNDTNDTTTPTAVGTNSDSYTPLTTTVGTTYYYCIVTDNASATVTSYIVAITVNTSGGGGGSGTVLFSQDFNDATEVAYAANTEQAITATSDNNIVGKDVPSTKFTSITCNAKKTTGIGINSKTGGNNKDYTGKFGAYYNNTEGYWSIVKTTSFASTAPTAIKVEMDASFSPVSSGSNIGVQFAVGSEFTDGLTNTCPALSNCVAGFALPSNNTIRVAKYSTSNANTAINSSSATITNGDSYNKYTWIINNTDETLTYKGADGNNTTVAARCWDLWIGTSRNLAGISQSTTGMSGTSLENIYIGSPFGKKHEFILDDIVVTDLSPAAMRTTTATIKAGKQYATFNTTMDIDFDETDGLQAFVVDNATKSSVHLREVTVVPANTALIIKGAPNTYTLYETKKATESVSDNQLIISNSTVAADNMYYALGTVNGVQGFHRVQNGLTIPTSYVIITDQTAKSFLNFEEEENIATGIDGFATDNGFIVIDDNTPLYNLSGQRVSKSYKGIVIINGKKVLRK